MSGKGCKKCHTKSRRRRNKDKEGRDRDYKDNDKSSGCGCGNPCKVERDECSDDDVICTPYPPVGIYELSKSDNCSADALNAIIREFENSRFQEAVIMIPASVQINDKICLTTTKKISFCGDLCHPALFNGDIVSCGNKNYSGINLGGNGIYQLNDTCNICPAPDEFNNVIVSCDRSFVSNSKSGFTFSNSEFNIKQSKKFVIRMSQGNLRFDNNQVNLNPGSDAVGFTYYDSGDKHLITDSEFRVTDGNRCCDYGLHVLNSCTHVDSVGNSYYVECQTNITIFLGDMNPAAVVHSINDYAEESDTSATITLMKNIPGDTLFSGSTYLISKLIVLDTTKARLGNTESRKAGITKFTGVAWINPSNRDEPAISITSDQLPDSLGDTYTLEINNSEISADLNVDTIQVFGDQPMHFTSVQSTFQNRTGDLTLRYFSGENTNIITYTYGSLSVFFTPADNTGGLVALGAASPVF